MYNTTMFVDEIEIVAKAGDGGDGKISFGKHRRSGPDGGNGGDGGDLYFIGSSDLTLLSQFMSKKEMSAEDGEHGGIKKMSGANGSDLEIYVPIGTSVIDIRSTIELFDIKIVGQKELICSGGVGGLGNYEFRSSTNTTPEIAERGEPGETKNLKLELKLIAEYGFIGLPNVGKSSLLNEITNSKAKTADYHFTTLSPNLGVLNEKILADIPGLIKGASEGKGLGFKFLKHIEKVKTLLHCISADSVVPKNDYEIIRKEMRNYNKKLLNKPEIILLTKSDLVDSKKISKLKKIFKDKAEKVLPVSIHDWESLDELKKMIS